MGYFSNGSEGMDYEAQFCERCIHGQSEEAWSSIETAPNDGTPILVWWPYWNNTQPLVARFVQGQWRNEFALEGGSTLPTHWLPLPEPPE
jgi:hypothetical protein